MGHCIPWAGYLGTKKIRDQIASRFFWPGTKREVEESYCLLAGDKNVPKFPLQPLLVIEVPFSHIAMDIVGLLERIVKRGFTLQVPGL